MTAPSIGLFLGRPERSARLARGLRDRGFPVTHYNVPGFEGDPYVAVRGRFVAALSRCLRTDHDVYCTGLSHVPSTCLYLNRKLRGRPYVFNATGAKWEMFHDRSKHRLLSGVFERRIHPFLLDRAYAGADRIVTNSRFLEAKIAERFPAYRDRLLTIYNGIDVERYSSGEPRALPGIGRGDFVILCVTALNYRNKSSGLRLVFDAFREVSAREPRAKLVVAAKTSDPAYREFAVACVERKGVGDSTVLVFNDSNVPGLLASADVFLYATPDDSNDSLPRALLEAQAAGVPAVTTATSGCPEIVADGETGRAVDYDAESLAAAVLELAHSTRKRQAMGGAAAERVRRVFSWDQMANRYAAVFRQIAAQPAAKSSPSPALRAASPQGERRTRMTDTADRSRGAQR